ncbi:hypothetical protein SAMN05192529_107157 [Arachidicoccus rhizosphaerae]|uniref:Uncharacterized protein n=1 Tax=Arachidicoccus rhizosphaerae TaxID=551991 RepID=A0A1H3Y7W2_9BACT|nr:hypothetical protein [Arachidicoccus rhizosphaerae]SEA07749.1 hypothetical protein SAMN05192529_107157 [Arachidicoccus rhizosphaerae]
MSKKQKEDYELSLKRLADDYATNKTSREEGEAIGEARGREKERIELTTEWIKSLLEMTQLSVAEIAKVVSVDESFVLAIQNEQHKEI